MDHPRMLYRPGTTLRVWNMYDIDYLIVDSSEEERAAIAKGWTRLPGEKAQAPEPRKVWGDHDRDGRTGGSLSGEFSTVSRGRRKQGTLRNV